MDEYQALVDDVCSTVLTDAPEVEKMLRLLFQRRHESLNDKALAELIKQRKDDSFAARDRARKQCSALRKKLGLYSASRQAKNHRFTLTLPDARGKGYRLSFERRPAVDQRKERAEKTANDLWPHLKPLFLKLCEEQLWGLPEMRRRQIDLFGLALEFLKSFSQPACVVTTLDEEMGYIFPLLRWNVYQQHIHSECAPGTHSRTCVNATKYSYTIDLTHAPADRSVGIPLTDLLVHTLGIENALVRIGCHEDGFLVFGKSSIMDEAIGPLSLHPNILTRLAEMREEAVAFVAEIDGILGTPTAPPKQGSAIAPKKGRAKAR